MKDYVVTIIENLYQYMTILELDKNLIHILYENLALILKILQGDCLCFYYYVFASFTLLYIY